MGQFEDIGRGNALSGGGACFLRAFDEENCNDWRKSSLRRELNGAFLDALVAEGADRAAFLDWESDLTADDGMTDYGTATDKIALAVRRALPQVSGDHPARGRMVLEPDPVDV